MHSLIILIGNDSSCQLNCCLWLWEQIKIILEKLKEENKICYLQKEIKALSDWSDKNYKAIKMDARKGQEWVEKYQSFLHLLENKYKEITAKDSFEIRLLYFDEQQKKLVEDKKKFIKSKDIKIDKEIMVIIHGNPYRVRRMYAPKIKFDEKNYQGSQEITDNITAKTLANYLKNEILLRSQFVITSLRLKSCRSTFTGLELLLNLCDTKIEKIICFCVNTFVTSISSDDGIIIYERGENNKLKCTAKFSFINESFNIAYNNFNKHDSVTQGDDVKVYKGLSPFINKLDELEQRRYKLSKVDDTIYLTFDEKKEWGIAFSNYRELGNETFCGYIKDLINNNKKYKWLIKISTILNESINSPELKQKLKKYKGNNIENYFDITTILTENEIEEILRIFNKENLGCKHIITTFSEIFTDYKNILQVQKLNAREYRCNFEYEKRL